MSLYCIRDLAIDDPQLPTVVERSARDSDVHVRLAALNVLARLSNSSDTAARITLDRLETDSDPGDGYCSPQQRSEMSRLPCCVSSPRSKMRPPTAPTNRSLGPRRARSTD